MDSHMDHSHHSTDPPHHHTTGAHDHGGGDGSMGGGHEGHGGMVRGVATVCRLVVGGAHILEANLLMLSLPRRWPSTLVTTEWSFCSAAWSSTHLEVGPFPCWVWSSADCVFCFLTTPFSPYSRPIRDGCGVHRCLPIGCPVRGLEDRSRGAAASQSSQRALQLHATPREWWDGAHGDTQDCRVGG